MATEVYPGLWLGDIQTATDDTFLEKHNIACIINCTATLPFSKLPSIKYKYRVPVKDNQQQDQIYLMYTLLDRTVNIIQKHLPYNNILVHCHAGRQRSVSIIVAFFMKCGAVNLHDAIICVQSKRDIAGQPSFNFMQALKEYELELQTAKSDA